MERLSSCPGLGPLSPSPDHHFYDESKPFTCLDGSASIPFDQVNDDYCDCKDGSDEPGERFLHSFIHSFIHCTFTELVSAASCVVSQTDPVPSSEGSLLSGGKQAQNKGGQWFGEEMRRRYGSPEEEGGAWQGPVGRAPVQRGRSEPRSDLFQGPRVQWSFLSLPGISYSHISHTPVCMWWA